MCILNLNFGVRGQLLPVAFHFICSSHQDVFLSVVCDSEDNLVNLASSTTCSMTSFSFLISAAFKSCDKFTLRPAVHNNLPSFDSDGLLVSLTHLLRSPSPPPTSGSVPGLFGRRFTVTPIP
ncbi:hypothetical protein LENED_004932 [Lentinula edodes]|uniref:Uncharacterized protein n=1 Tax=Lentinula edodes TaxID=5353 RepID=A0A1Q3E837_LENED|nr:hypothetical protein LENED_004932 [Lentinula edodes]